jgi:hypothetical protein
MAALRVGETAAGLDTRRRVRNDVGITLRSPLPLP